MHAKTSSATNPNLTFFDTYGVCNDLGDADVVNTIWYYNYKFLNNVNNALSALEKADDAPENKYYKGICLSYRAMIYMDLVRMYEYKKKKNRSREIRCRSSQ